jgi:hypothetical protein
MACRERAISTPIRSLFAIHDTLSYDLFELEAVLCVADVAYLMKQTIYSVVATVRTLKLQCKSRMRDFTLCYL